MEIQAGGLTFENEGLFNFGTVTTGSTSQSITFTIQNTGTENILLGDLPIVIGGEDAGDFSVTAPGITELAPGATATFTVTFTPSGPGTRDGVITIMNNENQEIFTLNLSGTGSTTPVPDIYLENSGTYYASGSGYTFGSVTVGSSSAAAVFTVRNPGAATLSLTGSPAVAVSGANASDFIVSGPAGASIAAGMSDTFTVTFTPTAVGSRSAVITILSDDPDIGSYTVNLSGTGDPAPVPDINLRAGVSAYPTGSAYSFGTVILGSSGVATFTVQNLGNLELNIASVTVAGPADFASAAPGLTTIPAGGSTTFSVTFTPSALGGFTAVLTIASDDPDESAYVISLSGTGSPVPVPEINIRSGGTDYPSASGYGFGTVTIGTPSPVIFTIENLGSGTLALTGAPVIDVTGPNAADFVVSGPGASSIIAGDSEDFTVTFTPSMAGTHTALLTIASDDADENPYTINLSGDGTAAAVPDINVQYLGTDYLSTSLFMFPDVPVGGTSGDLTFTIQNLGTGALTISPPTLSGADAAEFTVDNLVSTVIPAGSSTTFTLSFNPAAAGGRSALLTIATDDPDELSYTINLVGNGIAPEIHLMAGAVDYYSGDPYPFGSVAVGTPVPVTFTIYNQGSDILNLTSVTTATGEYVVSGPASMTIGAGGSETFTVTFTPSSAMTFNDTLTIVSDDANESTYTVSLSGTGTAAPTPDINLLVSGVDHPSGDTITFGSVNIGASTPDITFTIQNLGSSDLNLSGAPLVFIGGTAAGDYLVTQPAISTIPVSGSATFTVTFMPTAAGPRDAEITIFSNDPDAGESPYTLYLSGTGTAPEIDFQYSGSYASGSTFTFPGVPVGGSSGDLIFTIDNSAGTGALTIAAPTVSGPNAAEFAVGPPGLLIIPVGGSTTFTINFSPTGSGLRSAELTIVSDDTDESPYTVYLEGTGTVPEMDLRINSVDYSDGSTYVMPATNLGGTSAAVTFSIRNILGTAPLNLTGAPFVEISGINAGDFNVTQPASSPIAAGGSEDFTVTFTPSMVGNHTALLSIASDDGDENPYTVNLSGDGVGIPEINVQFNSVDLPSGNGVGFVSVNVGSSTTETFTIQNQGSGDLHITGHSLTNMADFSTDLATPTITAGGSTTFNVTFNPSVAGPCSGNITINSDDSDEGSYVVTLNGAGLAPEIDVQTGGSSTTAHDFGTVNPPLSSAPVIFTIRNEGNSDLTISDRMVSGTHAADFTVTPLGVATVPAGGTSSFTVIFKPGATGPRSATLSITSDDADESPYNIAFSGTGGSVSLPEINVKVGATDYPTGFSAHDFGNVTVNTSKTVTFTIQNTGVGGLNLLGMPAVSTGDFIVSGPAVTSIPGGGSANFTVTFVAPSVAATYNDTLVITSNDGDEASYSIDISGTSNAAPQPDIDVLIDGMEYLPGSTYDFGDVFLTFGTGEASVTVINNGVVDLTITSVDMMSGGPEFTSAMPASPIAPGTNQSFIITFSPTVLGARNDILRIWTDDPDPLENPVEINLTGNGSLVAVPDIHVEIAAVSYPSGKYFNFEALYPANSVATVEIWNLGDAALELYPPYATLSGIFAGDYTILSYPASTVSPGTSTTMDIRFTPGGKGVRPATLMIPNSDPDEGIYAVNLNGQPVIPVMVIHGGGASSTSVYNPIANVFSAGPNMYNLNPVGDGAHSFPITTGINMGRYMIIHGGSNNYTTLYNPADQSVTSGGNTFYNVGPGGHSFMIPGGAHANEQLIVSGGGTASINLFNPGSNMFEDGSPYGIYLSPSASNGSFHFPNTDNDMVVVLGNGEFYQVFDQDGTNTFDFAVSINGSTYITTGAHATKIMAGPYAGYMLIIEGDSTTTWLFEPTSTPVTLPGPPLTGTAYAGAFSIPITSGPNAGRILIVHGGDSPDTTIYNVDNTTVAGPTLPVTVRDGGFYFPITGGPFKGMYKIIHGSFYTDTTVFNPLSMQFFNLGDTLSDSSGIGAHALPAR